MGFQHVCCDLSPVYCLTAFIRIIIDWENCTWRIFTSSVSKEAGELGL